MAYQMLSVGSSGGGSGCSVENGGHDSHSQRKTYHRHTIEQIQRLDKFYKDCQHPDEKQRRQLGMELGLEPRQIKFWFQNKRTQKKAQNERADNSLLRSENQRIRSENNAIQETLQSMICVSCGGQPMGELERKQCFLRLQQENRELKHKYEKISAILAKCVGRPLPIAPVNLPDANTAGQESGSTFEVDSLIGSNNTDNLGSVHQMKASPEHEKLPLVVAEKAMGELLKLLRVDQPLWIKSPSDEQYVLDCDCYEKMVSGTTEFRFLNSRKESSKYSDVVAMNARWIVDLYLDADQWVQLFPAFISNSRIIQLLEAGFLENRSGSLQLIYEQMHILSPVMRPREFCLLRYCKQIETGIWVIADVSFDCFEGTSHVSPTCCWKRPSGIMIEELPNGLSRVTSVEHVEVDDNFQIHPIYEDLVKSALCFGAKRRITTLWRTCERFSYLVEAGKPSGMSGRGRRSMIMLASKMVKSYCSIFSLFGTEDFLQLSERTNNRVQIAVRKNTSSDQPVGIIISAASSFWVPASPVRVFGYLTDGIMRSQWDVLCNGSSVYEVLQISTGSNPSNVISILQPLDPVENLMIFQERMVDQMGSLIVYAPVDTSSMIDLATGRGRSRIPILASGFAITPDGPDKVAAPSTSTSNSSPGGSVITLAFQILACSSLSMDDMSMNLVSMADAFVSHAVRVIKTALDSSN